jgi:hypothetical protein
MPTTLEARQFARDWIAAWNSHDLDRILSHYASNVVLSSPAAAKLLKEQSGTVNGIDGLRNYFQRGLDAFPNLRFDLIDVLVGVSSVGDFNADGYADILWRNSSTGEVYLWLMNGTSTTSSGSLGNVSTDWSIAGVGDFDGDGQADILWWNSSTGQAYLWLMKGTTVSGGGSVSYVSAGWNIVGVGDFNGDGDADILWRNTTTGQVYVWLMNGTTLTSTGSPGTPDATWLIAP